MKDVLKGINFNRKIGQRTLDDDTLADFVQNFDKIPLMDDDFEFPDLLGAAYEWLIKLFADSAGKKAGEFYTPAEVVRICVEICDPQKGMRVYDPTAGSGGMLIQTRDYLRECGGDSDEIALFGQEKIGTTWSICKMNMLLHGISHADIRQQDTIREPRHLDENNELKRFDRVLANPPFSQNYIKKDLKFPGRFPVMMPEKGKKADLMFVQHMLAVLKHDGRMATVMPHGVLFLGGEEREARKYFIQKGYLEAVIGLPSNLFYGTGIPACLLVMNKEGAARREHVLFINADREYREGKAQNHLRPEDIDIVHAYRRGEDVPAYARKVPRAEIAAEDYNCNIRRYVDNAPPPEPHDVRAHLHGGVSIVEVDALEHFWRNYAGLREDCFVPRDETYLDLSEAITEKRLIPDVVASHPGVIECHESFMRQLATWWQEILPMVEALAPGPDNHHENSGNVYRMRRSLLKSISEVMTGQNLLTPFQVRGAFANYVNLLKADFKSIAASGWGPELIPDEDILQSQFPEVLQELELAQTRLAELQALFAAADDEDFEDTEDIGVMAGSEVKNRKEELKNANVEWKGHLKELKALAASIFTEIKAAGLQPKDAKKGFYCSEGFSQKEPNFKNGRRILQLAEQVGHPSEYIKPLTYAMEQGSLAWERAQSIEQSLSRHKVLEDEVKALKATIKGIENKRDELVESARQKISRDEARTVIVERLRRVLGFLRPSKGSIIFDGVDVTDKKPHHHARMGMGRTFQITPFFGEFTTFENIVASYYLSADRSLWGSLFRTRTYREKEAEVQQLAEENMKFVGLEKVRDELAGNLSHGHQKVLDLAAALAIKPRFLLLDEPIGGMSREETDLALNAIKKVHEQGTTILLVEHNVSIVMGLCDHIVVINYGRRITRRSQGQPGSYPSLLRW